MAVPVAALRQARAMGGTLPGAALASAVAMHAAWMFDCTHCTVAQSLKQTFAHGRWRDVAQLARVAL
jgi:hypothetical protein